MKLENYRDNLFKVIADYESNKFKYGQFDCCLFAAYCVDAVTGSAHAVKYRGKYRSRNGGLKLLKAEGFSNYVEAFASHFDEVPVALGQFGDIAIVELDNGGIAMGVVGGPIVLCVSDEIGLVRIPLMNASRVLRVE